jgi:hypothetical protein
MLTPFGLEQKKKNYCYLEVPELCAILHIRDSQSFNQISSEYFILRALAFE